MDAFVVLIKAPPQTGKTSILQLAMMQLNWLQEQFPDYDIQMRFVSLLKGANLDEALRKSFPNPQDPFHGWDRVCQTPPSSGSGEWFGCHAKDGLLFDHIGLLSCMNNASNMCVIARFFAPSTPCWQGVRDSCNACA